MKVLNYKGEIFNGDDDESQIVTLLDDGAEQLPDIFGDYGTYADDTNTTKIDDVWTFNENIVKPRIIASNESSAKSTRDEAIIADIEVYDVWWQVRDVDRIKMSEVITTASSLGFPDTTKQSWILADNTVRDTTALELQAVLDAQVMRQSPIFAAYSTWRAGDKLTPFVL